MRFVRTFRVLASAIAVTLCASAAVGVEYGNITSNTDGSSVTIPVGESTANFFIYTAGTNSGDYGIRIGATQTDDVAGGVLISSVRQNGRPTNSASGFAISMIAADPAGYYFIPVNTAGVASAETNMNVAAAYFSFSEGWQTGHALNTSNGGPLTILNATPGLSLGTNFIDDGGGLARLYLPGVNTQTDGVLLVNGGKNENNFALSAPSADGSHFRIANHDSQANASATEQDPVAFAYVPLGTQNATIGRIVGNGSTDSALTARNGTAVVSQGNFAIQSTANDGEYRLTIEGQTPTSGTLIVTPEGFGSGNVDNIVTYQASGNAWLIQTRDLPGVTGQNLDPTEGAFNFVFMPFATPVTTPGVKPTFDAAKVGAATVNVTEFNSGNGAGDMYAQVRGGSSGQFVYSMNRGDNVMGFGSGAMTAADGVLLASISEFTRNNSGTGGLNNFGLANVNISGGNYVVTTFTADQNASEHNIDFATAYFPNSAGFQTGAQVAAPSGLATLNLAGSGDTRKSGVLMVTPVSNSGYGATVSPDAGGTGWNIQVRESNQDLVTGNFNYAFLPYGTENLVAGQVTSTGHLSSRVGDFILTRESTGEYLLTIDGKSPATGMLLLNAGNATGVDQDNAAFYRADGNSFRIQLRDLGAAGSLTLQDTNFSFAYVDYDAPPSNPQLRTFDPTLPVGANVIVRQNNTSNNEFSVSLNTQGSDFFNFPGNDNINGDYVVHIDSAPVALQNGVMMATIRQHNTGATVSTVHNGLNAETSFALQYVGVSGGEADVQMSAVYFPFAGDFKGAHVAGNGSVLSNSDNFFGTSALTNTPGTGVYNLSLPFVDSRTDGLLFAINGANNAGAVTAAVNPDGSGWTIGHRGGAGTLSEGPFSLLFLPISALDFSQVNNINAAPNYSTENLIGGRIAGDGTEILSQGTFSITPQGVGQYLLSIPGVSPDEGVLLLTAAGFDGGVPDDAMFSYIDDGNGNFLIEARDFAGNLQNADFVFAFSSFDDLLAMNFEMLAVPEPSSVALWLLAGVISAGLFCGVLRRNKA